MSIVRGLVRGIAGLVAVGVAIVIVVPAVLTVAAISIPILILLAMVGVVGAGTVLSIGLRTIVAVILGLVALALAIAFFGIAIPFGILLLKVTLFGLLLVWLARRVFGWQSRPRREAQLVGLPVMDVAAPRRDKYDIAAERELDEELGI